MSQLRARYPASPLNAQADPARGFPSPGARLGDDTVRSDGRWTRLHELTARPGLHLLVQRDGPRQLGEDLQRRIGLGELAVHRLVDRPGSAICLVRPDGHVAVRAGGGELQIVGDWLEHFGPSDPPGQPEALT